MDATEPGSTAFTFLHALDLPCQGRGWYAIRGIGRDLGLADNETREVIRHLAAHRLLAWRAGRGGGGCPTRGQPLVLRTSAAQATSWKAVITASRS